MRLGRTAAKELDVTDTTTDPARWQHVKDLLAQALELVPDERARFLDEACAGDRSLRAEIDSLLAFSQDADDRMHSLPPVWVADEAPAASRNWIGRRLGAWCIVARIGGGGMGEVYRAERVDGQFAQEVAIKVMRDGFNPEGLAVRFKAERQILASLDHPNLAKVLDGGIAEDGAPYIVMELVDGEPIDVYVTRRRLSIDDRVRLFRSVCQVVHYAHQKRVVHRDLKADNILVRHDGVVKLVDFGIAKRIDPGAAEPATRTATAQRAMTLVYSSPEQVRGGEITPASDIYSLGVVLYRLLTNASPYPAEASDSPYELTRAICDTEPVLPSAAAAASEPESVRRRLRGDLDAVVMMALRKDPARRYATAEAMSEDLFRHLEGLPVQARRGAWSYRAGRFMLRHRGALAMAVVANLALVAVLGLAAYEGVQARRERVLAQSHFESVRGLAHAFIFDVHDSIARLPGSLDARRKLVDTALVYLKRLGGESQNDPELQLEIASGYDHIGEIQGGGTVANLGDAKGGIASFDRALAIVRPLMASPGPAQRDAATEFVTLSAHEGSALMSQGRWREAEALLREGLGVAQARVDAVPGDYDALKRQASSSGLLTLMYLRSANRVAFDAMSKQHLAQEERLHALRPDDIDVVADLGTAHTARAVNLMQNVDTPESRREALGEYQRALDIMEPAYARNPLHWILASNYGRTQGYFGHLLTQMGQSKEALVHLRRAVEVADAMAAKDPREVGAGTEQAEAHGRLGEALLQLHDAAGGTEQAEQSWAAFSALPQQTQDEVIIQFNRAATQSLIGRSLQARAGQETGAAAQHDDAAACQHLRAAQALLEVNLPRRASSPMTESMKQSVDADAAPCRGTAGRSGANEHL
jgi:eukaryotic-like serine/threonine-protein kinase